MLDEFSQFFKNLIFDWSEKMIDEKNVVNESTTQNNLGMYVEMKEARKVTAKEQKFNTDLLKMRCYMDDVNGFVKLKSNPKLYHSVRGVKWIDFFNHVNNWMMEKKVVHIAKSQFELLIGHHGLDQFEIYPMNFGKTNINMVRPMMNKNVSSNPKPKKITPLQVVEVSGPKSVPESMDNAFQLYEDENVPYSAPTTNQGSPTGFAPKSNLFQENVIPPIAPPRDPSLSPKLNAVVELPDYIHDVEERPVERPVDKRSYNELFIDSIMEAWRTLEIEHSEPPTKVAKVDENSTIKGTESHCDTVNPRPIITVRNVSNDVVMKNPIPLSPNLQSRCLGRVYEVFKNNEAITQSEIRKILHLTITACWTFIETAILDNLIGFYTMSNGKTLYYINELLLNK